MVSFTPLLYPFYQNPKNKKLNVRQATKIYENWSIDPRKKIVKHSLLP